jgi:hypothetical protein
MRGEGSDKISLRAIGFGRVGFNVTANISAREPRGAKNAEHDVGEVLANAFSFFPNTGQRR